MSDYKLTTQQVEDGFSHEPEYEYSNPIGYGAHVQSNRRAFRRWLAEVERAAAEKAWEEGRRATELEYEHIFHGHTDQEGEMCDECAEWSINPYRQEDS